MQVGVQLGKDLDLYKHCLLRRVSIKRRGFEVCGRLLEVLRYVRLRLGIGFGDMLMVRNRVRVRPKKMNWPVAGGADVVFTVTRY